jgi:hypothetical protein
MKPGLLAMLLGVLLLSGCTRHYVLTLSNGHRITTIGKPQLREDAYFFTDVTGQAGSISTMRVREIAPASMARPSSNSGFKAAPRP